MAQNVLTDTIEHIFANHNSSLEKRYNSKNSKAFKKRELELALTVILVDLASCDQNFDTAEYQIIVKGLNRVFGTSLQEVGALVQQASQSLGQLRGTSRWAGVLKEHLTADQRKAVMDVIEEVIQADGVLDGFEIYLRHKFADLLEIKIADKPAEAAS